MTKSWLTVAAFGLAVCVNAAASAEGDQRLLTDLVGSPVEDSAGVPVGVVQDVLFSDGRAATLVVGLLGSLGVGEKDVAVPYSSIAEITRGAGDGAGRSGADRAAGPLLIRMNASEASLVAAPAFHAGHGPSATGSPSPASGAPEGVTKEPKSSTESGGPG